MKKSVYDLQSIARAGGGLILNAKDYSTHDLQGIARAAEDTKARIHIKDASTKSTYDLQSIARAGKGCVSFEF